MSSRPREKLSRLLNNFQEFERFVNAGLDLFFPPRCALCDNEEGPFRLPMLCRRCWVSLYNPMEFTLPGQPSLAVSGLAGGKYEGGLRELIHRAKFQADALALPPLKSLMEATGLERSIKSVDLVTSIPSDKRRLQKRGISLPSLLARDLARKLHVPYRPRILGRTREISPQEGLSRQARLQNVAEAFCGSTPVENLHLLLVDDVCTTGATFSSASRALVNLGASKVTCLASARTPAQKL